MMTASASVHAEAETYTLSGEARAIFAAPSANPRGPLAAANALAPGLAPATPGSGTGELELRGQWQALAANVVLGHTWADGAHDSDTSRVNELHASGSLGSWQWSAGKKIVAWDVGYGYRPNDVVEQEARRTLLGTTPEGRPLLQAEHFGADDALSLVWVNPQRLDDAADTQRGAGESALAARWYRHAGAWDWHAFARAGRHTGASLGAAAAWVATDELELHASARAGVRHDGWVQAEGTGTGLVSGNPWHQGGMGGAGQWLLGGNWTGSAQQSLIVEAWHDGSAPSDAAWNEWARRDQALVQLGAKPGLPSALKTCIAGNLAWQASPFNGPSLRRDNLFVRLAWQPEAWQLSLDLLTTPADHGRVITAALQWQGDQWRLNAAWRSMGGPASAVMAQLPSQRTLLLAATRAF
jgi:hypothetical protein